uniref:Uncharacterized protein n=1 Tax=Timema bartmani TaxID=61472 RepID=A0A7R9ESD3_9NEOP|nr:unnamed protein product [Timema bartmani]
MIASVFQPWKLENCPTRHHHHRHHPNNHHNHCNSHRDTSRHPAGNGNGNGRHKNEVRKEVEKFPRDLDDYRDRYFAFRDRIVKECSELWEEGDSRRFTERRKKTVRFDRDWGSAVRWGSDRQGSQDSQTKDSGIDTSSTFTSSEDSNRGEGPKRLSLAGCLITRPLLVEVNRAGVPLEADSSLMGCLIYWGRLKGLLMGKSGTETFQMMQSYGNEVVSHPVGFEWHLHFRSGRT